MKLSAIAIVCFAFIHSATPQGGSRYSCARRCYEPRPYSWCRCSNDCNLPPHLVPSGCCRDYQRHCYSFTTFPPPPPPPPPPRRCLRPPPTQKNGKFSPVNREYFHGSTVTYTCNRGFVASEDDVSSTCRNGEWYPRSIRRCRAPIFQFCNAPEVNDPLVTYEPQNDAYIVSAQIYFSCRNEGYQLIGSAIVTCAATHTWSPDFPTCERISCPHVTSPIFGGYSPPGKTSWYPGDTVTYHCNRCYTLQGDEKGRCLNDGTWNHPAPTCDPGCGRPRSPRNGFIVPRNKECFEDKERIRYRCNRGYEVQGNRVVTCNRGAWSRAPTCKRIECPHRDPPTYGSYVPRGKTTWYPDDTATYSCPPYYTLVGNAESTCRYNGRWSSRVPVCRLTSPCKNRCLAEYSEDVICQCHPYCTEECCPDAGYCDPCPTLYDPDYGRVDANGKKARYYCVDGYDLVGNGRRTCTNGEWDGSAPTCEISDQDLPSNPSCAGRCGKPGGTIEFPCDCDKACEDYISCCSDYSDHCSSNS